MEMLQVKNNRIIDAHARPLTLRGTCIGGWMNMENFIDGYPGAESSLRATMAAVLGADKAAFFFEKLLDYFLAEEDLAFLQECGVNVVRLPLNYRHFERDDAPFQYLEAGFRRLDQVIDGCARHGLYVILDLHAVQGWQNPDWHCDNSNGQILFWRHPHFQDRFVALWEEFARRYRDNPTVAGYNVMNEPVCGWGEGRSLLPYRTDWAILNSVYRRVVEAIRAVDPQHIIFIEGDWFSNYFERLDPPFADNLVYSSHNYTSAGFGPGPYPGQVRGQYWDRTKLFQLISGHQGVRYAYRHSVPLWVGEFGSVYNGPAEERPDRLRALDDEINIFEEIGIHWTTWTYKDVEVMGWVRLDPACDYLRIIRPVLDAKAALGTDMWQGWLPPTPARVLVGQLSGLVRERLPQEGIDLPQLHGWLSAAALAETAGTMLQTAYAQCFRGMSEGELDQVLQSFAFRNCRVDEEMVAVLRKYLRKV